MNKLADQLDLTELAHDLMRQHGLTPEFPGQVKKEVAALPATPDARDSAGVRDLRSLLWSSIDNPESRDLDQVEYAEHLTDGTIRLMIGIADVDALVPCNSATDQHAAHNTVSVYTGVVVFNMLPERLATDLTSLNEGADRLAVVVELRIAADGRVADSRVLRAWVHNHAKLDYQTVGTWLDGGPAPTPIANNAALEQQLRIQTDAANRLQRLRDEAGALNIETIEARTVVVDGKVVDITVVAPNPAREIIENFMVASNVAMAGFLNDNGMPAIRRVVRTPRRWDRIVEIASGLGDTLPGEPDIKALSAFLEKRKRAAPADYSDLSMTVVKLLGAGEYVLDPRNGDAPDSGHFGLAVAEYAHSTAPNRRYPDLINQRLAKAVLAGQPSPYTDAELDRLARHCTKQEDAARKVERTMRKAAAAAMMSTRIGETFAAIVTGASKKATYVRLVAPPVEGRVIKGEAGLDVGATVNVRLVNVDAEAAHIDFEHVS